MKFSSVLSPEERKTIWDQVNAEWDFMRLVDTMAQSSAPDPLLEAYEQTKLTTEEEEVFMAEYVAAYSTTPLQDKPLWFKALEHQAASARMYENWMNQSNIQHMQDDLEDRFMLWTNKPLFRLLHNLYRGANYKNRRKTGMIVVDIEDFRGYNERFGYEQTDMVGFYTFAHIRLGIERRHDYTPVWAKYARHEPVVPRDRMVAGQIKTGDEAVFVFPHINDWGLLKEFEREVIEDILDPQRVGITLELGGVGRTGKYEEVHPRVHSASWILVEDEDPLERCEFLLGEKGPIGLHKKQREVLRAAESHATTMVA